MDARVERNINVLATSFDGECFTLITEDKEGNPLTVIQLQHQVFSEVKKLDKKQIVRNIVQHSRAAVTKEKLSVYNESYLRTGKVIVEAGLVLPKRPYIELRKAIAENQTAKDKRVARQTSSPNLSGKSASNASKRKGGGKDKENCDSVKAPKRKKLGGKVLQCSIQSHLQRGIGHGLIPRNTKLHSMLVMQRSSGQVNSMNGRKTAL